MINALLFPYEKGNDNKLPMFDDCKIISLLDATGGCSFELFAVRGLKSVPFGSCSSIPPMLSDDPENSIFLKISALSSSTWLNETPLTWLSLLVVDVDVSLKKGSVI